MLKSPLNSCIDNNVLMDKTMTFSGYKNASVSAIKKEYIKE